MDLVYVLRHKVRVEGIPVRRAARELGIHRATAKRYLEESVSIECRASSTRAAPVRSVIAPLVEEMLRESPRWTAGKQRLTAARVHALLLERGQRVGATLVKELVSEYKRKRKEVFVPLAYHPGELAEVDFFEVLVDVAGVRSKGWMFLMRMMYSGREFAWIYERQDQVSFLDAHVRAFAHLGGEPQRIIYDNLKLAVVRCLVGSERQLTNRFQALAAHYVFEPCFARPGEGHDKGGVESRGKAIRLQHLVPIPQGESLEEINLALLSRLDARNGDKTQKWEEEKPHLLPLPEFPFESRETRLLGVSSRALIRIDGACYSVPSRWAGLDVTAYIGPGDVEFVDGSGDRVKHRRQRSGRRSIDYTHYLRELARKPQALRQVIHELLAALGEPFTKCWLELSEDKTEKEAARAFAAVVEAAHTRGVAEVALLLQNAFESKTPWRRALWPPAPKRPVLEDLSLPTAFAGISITCAEAREYDFLLSEVAQ